MYGALEVQHTYIHTYNEGDILPMQIINSVSGRVRWCSIMLQRPVMAIAFRFGITKQTSSENMIIVIFIVNFDSGFNKHNTVFPIRDTPTETMVL